MRILSCLVLAAFAANAGDRLAPDTTPVVEVFLPPVVRPETNMVFLRARIVATEIYAAIGVRVIWRSNGHPPTGCAKQPMHQSIIVRFERSNSRLAGDEVQAWSNPYLTSGPCVTLMIDRAEAAIRLNPQSEGYVLGHVLAHEIGHVVQGITRHSDIGMMKARWSIEDIQDMMKNHRLEFTLYDADLIRSALGAPVRAR